MKNKRYTVKEYSKLYDKDQSTVYRWVKAKKLEYKIEESGIIMIPDNKWNRYLMNYK